MATQAAAAAAAAAAPVAATRPIYHTELDNTGGSRAKSQCIDGTSTVAPCTEIAARATCASATEPCFYDPTCKLGGLGCNAAGFESCRFCGFAQYSPITCPGGAPTTQVDVTVDVPAACPRACTSLSWETVRA